MENIEISIDLSFRSGASIESRTFVEFPNDAAFRAAFPPGPKCKGKPPRLCVVTGLPAKYKDPVTGMPYANAEAFKAIRKEYRKWLQEEYQDRECDTEVHNYLDSLTHDSN